MGVMVNEMGLEEDIKQTKAFKSQRHKALVNIIYTQAWLRDKLGTSLKPFGLTNQQYNVLRILRGSSPKPLSTSCIRSRMLDKMSDVSRIVDRLHKKGWVSKVVCAGDKRKVDIVISEEGLQVLDKIDVENEMEDVFSNLTEQDAEQLNQILDKVRD